MRQTGESTNSAKPASSKGARAGREPRRGAEASKPNLCGNAEAPPAAGALIDAAEWSPTHALASGLHLVATPIGNLGDITLRALWVLRGVDRILCEDTRVTGRLLARYGIAARMSPYHDHNADRVRPGILDALRRGDRLALVSDAGTPLVSDPGYKLVRAALDAGLPVTLAPGAAAPLAALTLSGLPPEPFLFAGFLPPRSAARCRALAELRPIPATLVFFEAPTRVAESLADMAECLGDRPAAVARELTKLHEEVRRDRLAALAAQYRETGAPRGEIVIVVAPPEQAAAAEIDVEARLKESLARLSVRDAVAELAAETGLARRELYRRALAVQTEDHQDEGAA